MGQAGVTQKDQIIRAAKSQVIQRCDVGDENTDTQRVKQTFSRPISN